MADGEDLAAGPALPANGLSAGTVPSSFRRSTFPARLLGSCASGPFTPPVVTYSMPSRPKAMRAGPFTPAPALKISLVSTSAVPFQRPRASASVVMTGGPALTCLAYDR